MIKLHPEYITKDGKKEFVVMPYKDFVSLQEYLADVEDLLELRKAKNRDSKKPAIPLEQVKKELLL